jgi:stage II sporulation protein R
MDMKVFRDVFAAILIGIMGGFLVSVISYYQGHKEGGVRQTAMAVLQSFDTVSQAYTGDDSVNVDDYELAENISTQNKTSQSLTEQVENVFERIEDGDETALNFVTSGETVNENLELTDDSVWNGEVLAMDGEDGGVSTGEPYSGILRFHVRANSDSTEDQELKMAVKEDVITLLRPLLEKCDDVKESKNIVVANLQNIYTTAVNTIVEQGYDYDVKVYVTEEEFPAKTYGDLTFPAGNYQALRIDIGEAKGQNWWCVMFPPLCFIDESTAVVSEEGKEALKRALTTEEYEALYAYYSGSGETAQDEEVTIKGESWLVNWWKEHAVKRKQ